MNSLDPIKYCDTCFKKNMPNLCEMYKNTFTKINSLHFSHQNRLDKLLTKLESMPRLVDRRWTCMIESSKREEFIQSLWGIGVSVHTIEDHVKTLMTLYKPEVRKLGPLKSIELTDNAAWEVFDPETRDFLPINITKKENKSIAKIESGNILKCKNTEGESFFRVLDDKNKSIMMPIEKRAAYNIITTFAKPSKTYWKTDEKNERGFVENKSLQNIPDEILNVITRLGKIDKKAPEFLIFENNEFEFVKTILSCIKIELERSTDIIKSVSTNKNSELLLIDDIDKTRFQIFIDIIKEIGGKVQLGKDYLQIDGKRGFCKIFFFESDKSIQDGTALYVSVQILEDPSRLTDLLYLIQKRLGLIDMQLQNLICQHWQIITDGDLQFVIQSAISWWESNKNMALSVISDQKKFDRVKEWHAKIKQGKIRSSLDTITLGKIIKLKEET